MKKNFIFGKIILTSLVVLFLIALNVSYVISVCPPACILDTSLQNNCNDCAIDAETPSDFNLCNNIPGCSCTWALGTCTFDINCITVNNACSSNCLATSSCCGNGVEELDETCDDGDSLNTNTCLNTCESSYCGDGFTQTPNNNGFIEECDEAALDNSAFCLSNCTYSVCGDNVCQSDETITNCFKDCVDGWITTDDTWFASADNLGIKGTGTSVIYSDYFDIKVNTSYTLSASATLNGRIISISLDNTCIGSNMIQGTCWGNTPYPELVLNNGGISTINLIRPNNSNAFNGQYFRNTRLKIVSALDCASSCASAGGSFAICMDICNSTSSIISNISFKEVVPSNIVYGDAPAYGVTTLSGCCPQGYCWDGKICVNSLDWMNNSQKKPLWNNLLDIDKWNNSHVSTSYQQIAAGYRCVVSDNNTGEAKWMPSSIKYDWNYNASGYCARETDCFVSSSYNSTDWNSNYSKGCIKDGDVISDFNDNLLDGSGNHYCHNGGWTTKSYIIATLLQNISVKAGHPYVLQCYDDNPTNYNTPFTDIETNILSTCVLTEKINSLDERVIIGVVLEKTSENGVLTPAEEFVKALVDNYNYMHNADLIATDYFSCISSLATGLENNLATCIDVENLYVYYDAKYKYFLISDRPINEVLPKTILRNIFDFFKTLFRGLFAQRANIVAYTAINHSTNYDKVYFLRSDTLNVTALEEAKYDESTQSLVTILYVKYIGSTNVNNPIDRNSLFNKTIVALIDKGIIGTTPNVTYTMTPGSQELTIKSQVPTGAWRSLITILRDRP